MFEPWRHCSLEESMIVVKMVRMRRLMRKMMGVCRDATNQSSRQVSVENRGGEP